MNFHEMNWQTKKSFIKDYFLKPLDSIKEISSGSDSDDYTLNDSFREMLKEQPKTYETIAPTQDDFVSNVKGSIPFFSIPAIIITMPNGEDILCSLNESRISNKGGSNDGIKNTQRANESNETSIEADDYNGISIEVDESNENSIEADESIENSTSLNGEDKSLNESGWITDEDSEDLVQSDDDGDDIN